MNAKKTILISIVLLSIVSCTEKVDTNKDKKQPTYSHDGRFGTECGAQLGGVAQNLCLLSNIQLLSSPEKYDGKLLAISGYLIREESGYYLFPNELEARSRNVESSILIKDLSDAYFEDKPGLAPPSHIRVVGRFDAHNEGPDKARFGMLNELLILTGN